MSGWAELVCIRRNQYSDSETQLACDQQGVIAQYQIQVQKPVNK